MSNNNDDFDKLFTEIVSSDDLKSISADFQANVNMGTKELLLIQQALADASSNIAEILLHHLSDGDFLFGDDNIFHSLLSSLYKIAEDFNECTMEFFAEEFFDDDDDEEGLEDE